ncbi:MULTISPECIES: PTS transporter subunit EIIC [Helcococcus]|uniref:PTS transporter subunit EIIC n=1 Tax=Helcococcus bovis TaxID=3153252 RepID=A0ABW9F4G7_9FIRM
MEKQELAKFILENVGGESNINTYSHCATRLRFNLKDEYLANTEAIQNTEGIVSVVKSGGQYQVIVGSGVADVYNEMTKLTKDNLEKGKVNNDGSEIKEKTNFFTALSAIFSPVLSAFAGSGILRALVILSNQMGILSETSGTYKILTIASMTVFYFLPVILAYTTAKYFKANPVLAMVIGAALIHPDLIAMMGETGNGTMTDFLGIPVTLMSYPSTVFPVIIAVWAFSHLERFLKNRIPEGGHLVFVPMISFFVMIPLTLIVIGPITYNVSNMIAGLINSLIESSPLLAGSLVGGGWNALVSVGLHWAVNPIMIQNIAGQGYDYIVPFTFATNFAMMGAALGVWLKAKHGNRKRYALTTALTIAFSGITEPAIYGVAMVLKKPFIAALIGGAVGGAYIGVQGVTAQSFVFGGLTTMPTFAGGQPGNMLHAAIGLAICVVVSAAITYIIGFDEPEIKK